MWTTYATNCFAEMDDICSARHPYIYTDEWVKFLTKLKIIIITVIKKNNYKIFVQ